MFPTNAHSNPLRGRRKQEYNFKSSALRVIVKDRTVTSAFLLFLTLLPIFVPRPNRQSKGKDACPSRESKAPNITFQAFHTQGVDRRVRRCRRREIRIVRRVPIEVLSECHGEKVSADHGRECN